MSRHELRELQEIADLMPTRPDWCAMRLEALIARVEREHAAEDRYHDTIEADAIPVNAEAA